MKLGVKYRSGKLLAEIEVKSEDAKVDEILAEIQKLKRVAVNRQRLTFRLVLLTQKEDKNR
jgi:hypothetical protein